MKQPILGVGNKYVYTKAILLLDSKSVGKNQTHQYKAVNTCSITRNDDVSFRVTP